MILVTGATGFLGSRLVFDLVEQGYPVKALRRKNSQVPPLLEKHNNRIEWVEGDVLDIFSLEEAMQNVDEVFHCAAYVSLDPAKKEKLYLINIEGTANVVNAALACGIKKMVHVSSVAALGSSLSGQIISEETQWDDSKSPYSISKFFSENEVWRGVAEGLNAVVINPSVIIGPGEIRRSSLRIFQRIKKGLNVYTSGGMGFVDVRDVSQCMIKLMKSDISGDRFIINSENMNYKDFISEAALALDKKPPRIFIPSWMLGICWRLSFVLSLFRLSSFRFSKENAHSARTFSKYSHQKIKDMLGVQFIPVKQSIVDTCKAMLN